ncbi:UNVERIFIED_CONTAM: hypothetical protein FKN15_020572 [Acipenser sinensis]
MDLKELTERINRNTAAQVEQTKRWRVELGLPEPTELDLLLQKWAVELPSREPEEVELPSREPEGVELPSREPEGVELPSRKPEGVELPSRKPEDVKPWLSQEPPAAVKGEEVPQPPTLQASPALPREVPRPDIVDTWPECPDLPTLDLAPRLQHCQAQLFAWSLSPLPLKPQTSRHGSQTSHTPPLPPTVFPLRLQTLLRRSTATHLCLPVLAPGHWPALQSPRASRPGPFSPVLGPSQEASVGLTHPQDRPWKTAKIKKMGLESKEIERRQYEARLFQQVSWV